MKLKIEKFGFGFITINGIIYHSDLIIYPDGTIEDRWWRKSGHLLSKDDIKSLIDMRPEIIVVGTGINGLMRPENDLADYLLEKGIELICAQNEEAISIYNNLSKNRIGACFHLTC